MSDDGYILITGASGFIGGALATRLSTDHRVICLSRRQPGSEPSRCVFARGEFHSFEDLRQLDAFPISCAVHLAAVTGGSTEEDALAVNVLGTRRLLRYLVDRGCYRFVLASSIAAVGCLNPAFIPVQLPIPDDHLCLARDAYGQSKAMMEDLTRYFNRVHPETSFIHLRLGSVLDDSDTVAQYSVAAPPRLPFVELARVMVSDVVRAFERAIVALPQNGVRVYNVVGPDVPCSDPVADVVRASLGSHIPEILLAQIENMMQHHHVLYTMTRIRDELSFVPLASLQ